MKANPIDATHMTLADVLDKLGWYAVQSTVPDHLRIFGKDGRLINVLQPEQVWDFLERMHLVTRRKEATT